MFLGSDQDPRREGTTMLRPTIYIPSGQIPRLDSRPIATNQSGAQPAPDATKHETNPAGERERSPEPEFQGV